jgi:hypothetical protein
VLVAVAGGACGLALTYLFIELLTRTVSSSPLFRLAVQLTPSPRVAALTFFTAVVVGIGLGLLPALAVTRTDLVGGLKAHASTRLAPYRRVGLRNLFVVYQITAATALVVIMGFFIAGIQQGGGRDVGFETAGLFMFSVDPVRDNYSPDRAAELITTLLEQLTGHATIAAAAWNTRFTGWRSNGLDRAFLPRWTSPFNEAANFPKLTCEETRRRGWRFRPSSITRQPTSSATSIPWAASSGSTTGS